ncbi:MAG: family NAD(P)-dependent oxidoreductase [Myxococcaceae bacterium]|nr:family NAD(P)-dependent oxidoreductase [Myxococcaceae bacterium]
MKSFQNKVAAITGAASGMGRSLAINLAKQGCHVAISDVDEKGLAETAKLADGHGMKVTSKRVDVANRAEVYAWADEVVADHGKCNLVFNNAGVGYGASVEGCEYPDAEWVVGINFWGVVYGTKAFLPHLRASGEGHVVNTSSVFGLLGFPGQSTYNATKFAVRGFTEALRIELDMTKAPVSATSVHPGGIKTNIARTARMNKSVLELGVKKMENNHLQVEKHFRTTADDAAAIILRGVQRNARRVLVGTDAKIFDLVQRVVPSSYQWLVIRAARLAMR